MKIAGHRTRSVFDLCTITDQTGTQQVSPMAEDFLVTENERLLESSAHTIED